MSKNFFSDIENKYKTRLSSKKTIVARLDGKNICKNIEINMLDENEGGFAYALKNTTKILSWKHNTLAFCSSDEINLIFLDSSKIKSTYGNLDTQKVSSLISQDVFLHFNKFYTKDLIYFDNRTFNINDNIIPKYINYRKISADNVNTMYYAKMYISGGNRYGLKKDELSNILYDMNSDFKYRSEHNTYGTCYFNGIEIDFDEIPNSVESQLELHSILTKISEDKINKDIISDEPTNDIYDDLDELFL